MTSKTFADLGLSPQILSALEAAGHSNPTPIQAQSIPELLTGRDLLGIAQTGTGKTAAFLLPLLHLLASRRERAQRNETRSLILAPTRELALQIGESLKTYGRNLRLSHSIVLGGVAQRPQERQLARGQDIVIATPGRLLALVREGHLKLHATRFLVLDEADRMLDMGFVNDVRRIAKALAPERQSLLFSATMPEAIGTLAGELLRDPAHVEVAPEKVAVERIDQSVMFVERPAKRTRLTDLLSDPEMSRVIVFTRTKHGADRVASHLDRAGIVAEALHGNKSQNARERALAAFRNGRARVLVATDIAARGIDVREVSHVVNFDLPNEPESYVHRIGRTARAGAGGSAISFCDASERAYLRAIEKLLRTRITVSGPEPEGYGQEDESRRAPRGKGRKPRFAGKPGGAPRQDGRQDGGQRHGGARNDNAKVGDQRPRRRGGQRPRRANQAA